MKKSVAWIAASALALSMLVVGVMSLSSSATPQRPIEVGRIYFDVDQPTLSKAVKAQVNAILPALGNAAKIEVGGYAGTSKTAKSKVQRLSLGRANQVAAYLKSKGVTAQLVVVSKGYATDTKVLSKMRRVVLVVLQYKAIPTPTSPSPTCSQPPRLIAGVGACPTPPCFPAVRADVNPCYTPPIPTPTFTTPTPSPTCVALHGLRSVISGCPTPPCVPTLKSDVNWCSPSPTIPTPTPTLTPTPTETATPTPTPTPTAANVTYTFKLKLSASPAGTISAAYPTIRVGLGASSDATYSSTTAADWSCNPSNCTTTKTVSAPSKQTAAYVTVSCVSNLGSPASHWAYYLYADGNSWLNRVEGSSSVTFAMTLPANDGDQTITELSLYLMAD